MPVRACPTLQRAMGKGYGKPYPYIPLWGRSRTASGDSGAGSTIGPRRLRATSKHGYRNYAQLHPHNQERLPPYRHRLSNPREVRHWNQDLRRAKASAQTRQTRHALSLELHLAPCSTCELIFGQTLRTSMQGLDGAKT